MTIVVPADTLKDSIWLDGVQDDVVFEALYE